MEQIGYTQEQIDAHNRMTLEERQKWVEEKTEEIRQRMLNLNPVKMKVISDEYQWNLYKKEHNLCQSNKTPAKKQKVKKKLIKI